jgi:hypothetical protein
MLNGRPGCALGGEDACTPWPPWARLIDTIPLSGRALHVVGVRATAVDQTPVLIVEDTS